MEGEGWDVEGGVEVQLKTIFIFCRREQSYIQTRPQWSADTVSIRGQENISQHVTIVKIDSKFRVTL